MRCRCKVKEGESWCGVMWVCRRRKSIAAFAEIAVRKTKYIKNCHCDFVRCSMRNVDRYLASISAESSTYLGSPTASRTRVLRSCVL